MNMVEWLACGSGDFLFLADRSPGGLTLYAPSGASPRGVTFEHGVDATQMGAALDAGAAQSR
jgi:hypothetical protein